MNEPIEHNLGHLPVEQRLHTSSEFVRTPAFGIVQLVDVLQSNASRLKQVLNAARCVSSAAEWLAAGALTILLQNPAITQDVLDGFNELIQVLSEVQTSILEKR